MYIHLGYCPLINGLAFITVLLPRHDTRDDAATGICICIMTRK